MRAAKPPAHSMPLLIDKIPERPGIRQIQLDSDVEFAGGLEHPEGGDYRAVSVRPAEA